MKYEGYITQEQFTDYKKSPIVVQTAQYVDREGALLWRSCGADNSKKNSVRRNCITGIYCHDNIEHRYAGSGEEALPKVWPKSIGSVSNVWESFAGLLNCNRSQDRRDSRFRGGRNYSKSQFDRVKQASDSLEAVLNVYLCSAIESAFRTGNSSPPRAFFLMIL